MPRKQVRPKTAAAKTGAWFVYILRCGDGSLYTGATNRLETRLLAHQQGKGARYTRSRAPVVLVFRERVGAKGAALSREWALKQLTRAEKLALVKRQARKRRASSSSASGPSKPRKRPSQPRRPRPPR